MVADYIPLEILKIKKYNDKIEKKLKDTYLWDAESSSFFILNNMVHEAGKDDENPQNFYRALFIAYRLKFADEKTIELMKDSLIFNKKNYCATINSDNTIYETMRFNNCDYFEALLIQYRDTIHCNKSKLPEKYIYHDQKKINDSNKICFSKLSDDNKTIIYMNKEDWEKEFGPYEIEFNIKDYSEINKLLYFRQENGIPYKIFYKNDSQLSEREKDKENEIFTLVNTNLSNEIKNWEIKFNKKTKKWNFIENKEFEKHLFEMRKKGEYI